MANLFSNLSNHPYLDYVVGNSEQEVLDQLKQIRLPFKIVSIYSMGSRTVAWVDCSRPIKKKTKDNKGE